MAGGTPENAVKTQFWIAVSVYVPVAPPHFVQH